MAFTKETSTHGVNSCSCHPFRDSETRIHHAEFCPQFSVNPERQFDVICYTHGAVFSDDGLCSWCGHWSVELIEPVFPQTRARNRDHRFQADLAMRRFFAHIEATRSRKRRRVYGRQIKP